MTYNLISQIEDAVITPDRIRWIGSQDGEYTLSWAEFKKRFKNVVHNPENPGTELAADLVIKMFDGSWYERDLAADGTWVHRHVPEAKGDSKPFDYVSEGDSPNGSWPWSTLEELNDKELMTMGGNDYAAE